ncbi:MAG: hypothetical protein R3C62_04935 [Chloroflexota bacterium]
MTHPTHPHPTTPPANGFPAPADADSLEDFLPGVSLRRFDTPPGHKIKANLNRGSGDGWRMPTTRWPSSWSATAPQPQ